MNVGCDPDIILQTEEAIFTGSGDALEQLDKDFLFECMCDNTPAKQQAIQSVLKRLQECTALGMQMLGSCSSNLARLLALQKQLAPYERRAYGWLDESGKG
jgi:hypothetical protein